MDYARMPYHKGQMLNVKMSVIKTVRAKLILHLSTRIIIYRFNTAKKKLV